MVVCTLHHCKIALPRISSEKEPVPRSLLPRGIHPPSLLIGRSRFKGSQPPPGKEYILWFFYEDYYDDEDIEYYDDDFAEDNLDWWWPPVSLLLLPIISPRIGPCSSATQTLQRSPRLLYIWCTLYYTHCPACAQSARAVWGVVWQKFDCSGHNRKMLFKEKDFLLPNQYLSLEKFWFFFGLKCIFGQKTLFSRIFATRPQFWSTARS